MKTFLPSALVITLLLSLFSCTTDNPADNLNSSLDPDKDGLTNAIEAKLGTNPNIADTDGDGILDGIEDFNKNGIVDKTIGLAGKTTNRTTGSISETNPIVADTDGDGLKDGSEDTDADGLTNSSESEASTSPYDTDSDDDGTSDELEDADNDGLSNGTEDQIGTDLGIQ